MIADGVMAQQASDDWLTSTLHRSGLYFHPLGMSCRHVVRESAELPLYVVHQPTDSTLWCMAVNKWLVLIWHDATLAKGKTVWGGGSPKSLVNLGDVVLIDTGDGQGDYGSFGNNG